MHSHCQILDFGNKGAPDIQKTQNLPSPTSTTCAYVFIFSNTSNLFRMLRTDLKIPVLKTKERCDKIFCESIFSAHEEKNCVENDSTCTEKGISRASELGIEKKLQWCLSEIT